MIKRVIERCKKKEYVLIAVLLFVSSCSTKEMAYVSDAERNQAQCILHTYSSVIHPGDELYISVISQTQEAAEPFNRSAPRSVENRGGGTNTILEVYRNLQIGDLGGYLVTESGTITFPILGELYVVGLPQDSLAHIIEQMLIEKRYLNDPIVTVTLLNFRVSVVGEVSSPQELHITGNRLTIFEALAMCGDVSLYGRRDHVSVLRDRDGKTRVIDIDLTKKSLFDSEAYYLQSNDVVYIEPNKVKIHKYGRAENIVNGISTSIAVSYLILRLLNVYMNVDNII